MDPIKSAQFKDGFLGMKPYDKGGVSNFPGDPLRQAKKGVIQQYTNKGQGVPSDVHQFLQEQNLTPEDVKLFGRQQKGFSGRGSGKRTASRKQNRA